MTYDWATMRITTAAGMVLATPLAKTCVRSAAWTRVTYGLGALAGKTVVLAFTSHDDNYPGDPTYHPVLRRDGRLTADPAARPPGGWPGMA